MSLYAIQLLGTFLVRRVDEPQAALLTSAPARLVGYLALAGAQQRVEVANVLWPDLPEERALAALRTVLSRTRRALPGLITNAGRSVQVTAGVVTDYEQVNGWALAALTSESETEAAAPDVVLDLLPRWDESWLDARREEYRVLRLAALEGVASRSLRHGNLGSACRHALLALRVDPTREFATRVLIEVHIREGNHGEALRRYQQFEQRVGQATGAGPSSSLQALVAPLLVSARETRVERPFSRHRNHVNRSAVS